MCYALNGKVGGRMRVSISGVFGVSAVMIIEGGVVEKLRENQYIEGYARCLGVRVKWDNSRNFEQMWKQVKRTMADSGRVVCERVKSSGLSGGMSDNVWWS